MRNSGRLPTSNKTNPESPRRSTMRIAAVLAVACILVQADASHFPLPDGALWVDKSCESRANPKVGEPGPPKEGPKRSIRCADGKEAPTLTTFDGKPSPAVRIFVTRDGVYPSSVDSANLILKFP